MFHRFISIVSILALLTTPLVLTACGGLGSFSFTEESDEIEVEGRDAITATLGEVFDDEIPLTVNLEQRLEEQDASGARSVHLTELEFRMTDNTEEEDFEFLNSIHIDVDANSQDRRQLATREGIPADDSFYLDVDDDLDLKPYVEEGMDLLTEVEGSQPDEDAVFRVYATFRVRVL